MTVHLLRTMLFGASPSFAQRVHQRSSDFWSQGWDDFPTGVGADDDEG